MLLQKIDEPIKVVTIHCDVAGEIYTTRNISNICHLDTFCHSSNRISFVAGNGPPIDKPIHVQEMVYNNVILLYAMSALSMAGLIMAVCFLVFNINNVQHS